MTNNTIVQEAEDIFAQAERLKKLMEEPTIVLNKIWLPGVGVVDLWEIKQK